MSTHLYQEQCCVWDKYKYALYTKLREPKLYRFAAGGDWDLIPSRCKTHPKEAMFIHKYAPMDTALSRLLRTDLCSLNACSVEMNTSIYDMKFQAVSSLLDVNSAATTHQDSFRRAPLHWACMDVTGNHREASLTFSTSSVSSSSLLSSSSSSKTGDSILLLLLERGPEAARMIDIEMRTPLHYLAARNKEIPVRLLAKMVALCPEALGMKDEVGETPVDIIKSRKSELKNVDSLVQTLLKLESMLSPSTQDALQSV